MNLKGILFSPFFATDRARFHLIDDLRGIAAFAVVLSHLVWLLPAPFLVFEYGRLGVEIFFVISGFVMAHSLRGANITGHFIGKFFLRRSLRLDPVYWTVIVLELLVLRFLWSGEIPGIATIIINAFYLQELLGYYPIVGVAWTLCLELQFYLVFVVLLGVSQALSRKTEISLDLSYGLIFGSMAFISIFADSAPAIHSLLDIVASVSGLFLPYWHMFFAGVLIHWVLQQNISPIFFWTYILTVLGVELASGIYPIFPDDNLSTLFALAVSCAVYISGKTALLKAGFGSKIISYFGRISYSLYLIHVTIGVNLIYIVEGRFGNGTILMFLTCATAVLLSVFGAHLLYIFAEAPAVELSSRAKNWSLVDYDVAFRN